MKIELKPCPLCGSDNVKIVSYGVPKGFDDSYYSFYQRNYIRCEDCRLTSTSFRIFATFSGEGGMIDVDYSQRDNVVALWNKRGEPNE